MSSINRGKSLMQIPLEERRKILTDTMQVLNKHSSLMCLSDTFDVNASELIPLVKQFGFEGIVANVCHRRLQAGQSTGLSDRRLLPRR